MARKTSSLPPPRPHTHWIRTRFATLTNKEVLLIRARYESGTRVGDLSIEYGVSIGTIYKAKNAVHTELVTIDVKTLSRSLKALAATIRRMSSVRKPKKAKVVRKHRKSA